MPPKPTRTHIQTVRFRPETAEAVKQAAYDSHRTVSSWIEVACILALESNLIKAISRPGDVDGKEENSDSL